MFDDEEPTQRMLRTEECGLLSWDRVAAALTSACAGDLSWGNVLVVSSAITALFKDDVSAAIPTAIGPIDRIRARAAWNSIATSTAPATPQAADVLWSLMFAAFAVHS